MRENTLKRITNSHWIVYLPLIKQQQQEKATINHHHRRRHMRENSQIRKTDVYLAIERKTTLAQMHIVAPPSTTDSGRYGGGTMQLGHKMNCSNAIKLTFFLQFHLPELLQRLHRRHR